MLNYIRPERRAFLKGTVALGALGAFGLAAGRGHAQTTTAATLPARGETLIRDAYVMTMDPAVGDIANGRVHLRDGAIVAVGADLEAPGATVIDGKGTIVLPGFVETHWHLWNALLRSMSGDSKKFGYFPTRTELGKAYTPDDMFQGARIGAVEAIYSGITTVHDWCHNIRAPDYARRDLDALREAGIRARFSYGPAAGQPADKPIDLADLEALSKDWAAHSGDGLISLGMAWRGPGTAEVAGSQEVGRREFETARRLGLPITIHASSTPQTAGQVDALAAGGFLGRDVQVVHATAITPEGLKALAESGTAVSLSPYSELRIGYGLTPTMKFLDAGVPTGLSVDTTALSGNADMFAIMKIIQNLANGMALDEFKLLPRRIIELATIEGARSMGLDASIGSLTPGKRADVIMVTMDAPNLGLFTDPAHLIVEAAQPSNVDTVIVDGRILKQGGRLTAADPEVIIGEASVALTELRKRANWW